MIENYVAMLLVTLGYALRAAGDPKEEEPPAFTPIDNPQNSDQSEILALRARVAELEQKLQAPVQAPVENNRALKFSFGGVELLSVKHTTTPTQRTPAVTEEQKRWLGLAGNVSRITFDGSCHEQYHRYGGLTDRQWEICIGNLPKLEYLCKYHSNYPIPPNNYMFKCRVYELPGRQTYDLNLDDDGDRYEET